MLSFYVSWSVFLLTLKQQKCFLSTLTSSSVAASALSADCVGRWDKYNPFTVVFRPPACSCPFCPLRSFVSRLFHSFSPLSSLRSLKIFHPRNSSVTHRDKWIQTPDIRMRSTGGWGEGGGVAAPNHWRKWMWTEAVEKCGADSAQPCLITVHLGQRP